MRGPEGGVADSDVEVKLARPPIRAGIASDGRVDGDHRQSYRQKVPGSWGRLELAVLDDAADRRADRGRIGSIGVAVEEDVKAVATGHGESVTRGRADNSHRM